MQLPSSDQTLPPRKLHSPEVTKIRIFSLFAAESPLGVFAGESGTEGKWDSVNIPELLLETRMMSMTKALEQPLINNSDDNGAIITY